MNFVMTISILNINKYNPKYYMNTDSFIINITTEDFYKDIASDVGKWFGTSNHDKNDKRPLSIEINKKSDWLV